MEKELYYLNIFLLTSNLHKIVLMDVNKENMKMIVRLIRYIYIYT
jgi:hypothetical protein